MTHFDKSHLHTGNVPDVQEPARASSSACEEAASWETTDDHIIDLVEDYYEISEEDAEALEAELRWQMLEAS